jgi:hypothetical protein
MVHTSNRLSSPVGPLEPSVAAQTQPIVVIELSSDLSTWRPVATNQAPVDGVVRFTDELRPGVQQRFYRSLGK